MGNHFTRTFFLLFLLCSVFQGFSQAIHGIVLDNNTKKAIPYANVYFNGTYIGTSANESGEFNLTWKENNPRPITATSVGYYSMTLYDYQIDSMIFIWLEPKVYDIAAVIIRADKMVGADRPDSIPRVKKERMFREEFLGKDYNASRCQIVNMEDIFLVYNDRNKSLSAYCDKPIIIENNALKYRIYYFLDQFISSKDSAFMSGTYYFREIPYSHTRLISDRRKNTYLGSRMHFIRSLWANRLEEEGFTTYIVDSGKIGYANLVVDSTAQEKILNQVKNVIVRYPKNYQKSWLIFNKQSVVIEKSGYFDPHGLRWSGFMASQRMADLLPFEYGVSE
jgi:hypothetical protein